jgi:hypothetical protein
MQRFSASAASIEANRCQIYFLDEAQYNTPFDSTQRH